LEADVQATLKLGFTLHRRMITKSLKHTIQFEKRAFFGLLSLLTWAMERTLLGAI